MCYFFEEISGYWFLCEIYKEWTYMYSKYSFLQQFYTFIIEPCFALSQIKYKVATRIGEPVQVVEHMPNMEKLNWIPSSACLPSTTSSTNLQIPPSGSSVPFVLLGQALSHQSHITKPSVIRSGLRPPPFWQHSCG